MAELEDTLQENPYVLIQSMEEMIDELSNSMDLKEFREALDLVVVFLAKPKDVPSKAKIAEMISRLSAYSALFKVQFANYMTWKKGVKNASYYKNTYKYLSEGIDLLVDSLKWWLKI